MSIYKGGYIIIDLNSIALDDGATISGIFAKISETWGKQVLFKNLSYNGDVFTLVTPTTANASGTPLTYNFYAWAGAGLLLTVRDDDSVTITVIE